MGWSTATDAASIAGLERAHALGARLFDTADVYGHGRSERLLGRLVRQVRRKELVLVSKVGYFAGTAAHGYDPRHMRRQLEQSLDNLGTEYLDIYFLHHADFGEGDRWLNGAVEAMRGFQREGLVRAVGMRGPHRFALDRLVAPPGRRGDKTARFRRVFEVVRPEVLAVRDNLLTPTAQSTGIFAFADEHDVGVLINKPLAQGLLAGGYRPENPPVFGEGDHRRRKRWFTAEALAILTEGLEQLREVLAGAPGENHRLSAVARRELIRLALWSCLDRSQRAAVLVGFTTPEQVDMNLACLGDQPPAEATMAAARQIMSEVQQRLDATGEVFVDETIGGSRT